MMILLFCLAVFLIVVVLAFMVKGLLGAISSPEKVAEKYASSPERRSIFVKKYKEADMKYYSGAFMRTGLLVILGLLLFAFNWKPKEDTGMEFVDDTFYEELEVEPPQTQQNQPPPPPPPPPPPVIEVVEDEEIIEEEPIIEEAEVDVEEVVEVVEVEAPAIEIEEPEPEPEEPEIFVIVEENAEYPGGNGELLKEIAQKLRYPPIAQENGIEGKVYLKFVVNEDGSVSNIQIAKDIGGGCGQAAVDAVQKLSKKFKPGKQRGKAVKVYFTLPVKFTLQG